MFKKSTAKRIFALLLTFCLVVGVFPVLSRADDEGGEYFKIESEVGNSSNISLAERLVEAKNAGKTKIKLLKDRFSAGKMLIGSQIKEFIGWDSNAWLMPPKDEACVRSVKANRDITFLKGAAASFSHIAFENAGGRIIVEAGATANFKQCTFDVPLYVFGGAVFTDCTFGEGVKVYRGTNATIEGAESVTEETQESILPHQALDFTVQGEIKGEVNAPLVDGAHVVLQKTGTDQADAEITWKCREVGTKKEFNNSHQLKSCTGLSIRIDGDALYFEGTPTTELFLQKYRLYAVVSTQGESVEKEIPFHLGKDPNYKELTLSFSPETLENGVVGENYDKSLQVTTEGTDYDKVRYGAFLVKRGGSEEAESLQQSETGLDVEKELVSGKKEGSIRITGSPLKAGEYDVVATATINSGAYKDSKYYKKIPLTVTDPLRFKLKPEQKEFLIGSEESIDEEIYVDILGEKAGTSQLTAEIQNKEGQVVQNSGLQVTVQGNNIKIQGKPHEVLKIEECFLRIQLTEGGETQGKKIPIRIELGYEQIHMKTDVKELKGIKGQTLRQNTIHIRYEGGNYEKVVKKGAYLKKNGQYIQDPDFSLDLDEEAKVLRLTGKPKEDGAYDVIAAATLELKSGKEVRLYDIIPLTVKDGNYQSVSIKSEPDLARIVSPVQGEINQELKISLRGDQKDEGHLYYEIRKNGVKAQDSGVHAEIEYSEEEDVYHAKISGSLKIEDAYLVIGVQNKEGEDMCKPLEIDLVKEVLPPFHIFMEPETNRLEGIAGKFNQKLTLRLEGEGSEEGALTWSLLEDGKPAEVSSSGLTISRNKDVFSIAGTLKVTNRRYQLKFEGKSKDETKKDVRILDLAIVADLQEEKITDSSYSVENYIQAIREKLQAGKRLKLIVAQDNTSLGKVSIGKDFSSIRGQKQDIVTGGFISASWGRGTLVFTKEANVVVENMIFKSDVTVEDGAKVHFKNCIFEKTVVNNGSSVFEDVVFRTKEISSSKKALYLGETKEPTNLVQASSPAEFPLVFSWEKGNPPSAKVGQKYTATLNYRLEGNKTDAKIEAYIDRQSGLSLRVNEDEKTLTIEGIPKKAGTYPIRLTVFKDGERRELEKAILIAAPIQVELRGSLQSFTIYENLSGAAGRAFRQETAQGLKKASFVDIVASASGGGGDAGGDAGAAAGNNEAGTSLKIYVKEGETEWKLFNDFYEVYKKNNPDARLGLKPYIVKEGSGLTVNAFGSSVMVEGSHPKQPGVYHVYVELSVGNEIIKSNEVDVKVLQADKSFEVLLRGVNASGKNQWQAEPYFIQKCGNAIAPQRKLDIRGSNTSGVYACIGSDSSLGGETITVPAGGELTLTNMKIFKSVKIIVEKGGVLILNDSSVFGPIEVYGTIKTKTRSSLQNILTMHDGSVMENLNVVSYNRSVKNIKETIVDDLVVIEGRVRAKGENRILADMGDANKIGQKALTVQKNARLTIEEGAAVHATGGGSEHHGYAVKGGSAVLLKGGTIDGKGSLYAIGGVGHSSQGYGGAGIGGKGTISVGRLYANGGNCIMDKGKQGQPGQGVERDVTVSTAEENKEVHNGEGKELSIDVDPTPIHIAPRQKLKKDLNIKISGENAAGASLTARLENGEKSGIEIAANHGGNGRWTLELSAESPKRGIYTLLLEAKNGNNNQTATPKRIEVRVEDNSGYGIELSPNVAKLEWEKDKEFKQEYGVAFTGVTGSLKLKDVNIYLRKTDGTKVEDPKETLGVALSLNEGSKKILLQGTPKAEAFEKENYQLFIEATITAGGRVLGTPEKALNIEIAEPQSQEEIIIEQVVITSGGASKVVIGKELQLGVRLEGKNTNNLPPKDQGATWSLEGNYKSGTTIDSTGLLRVSPEETSEKIVVVAKSKIQNKEGRLTLKVEKSVPNPGGNPPASGGSSPAPGGVPNTPSTPSQKEEGQEFITLKTNFNGKLYTAKGTRNAFNGAEELSVTMDEQGKTHMNFLDKEGNKVKTKGAVKVTMPIKEGMRPPYRIKVNGTYTTYGEENGNFVLILRPMENVEMKRLIHTVDGKEVLLEGTEEALNGATKIQVEKKPNGSLILHLYNEQGKEIKSKGYVFVEIPIPEGKKPPYKVTVGGKTTTFEETGRGTVAFGLLIQ